jgi:SAM-dependent methyltransferase
MSSWDEFAAQNRLAWNEVAEVRTRWRDGQGLDAPFFRAGGVCLPAYVVNAVGDVSGASILHLQCASGEESLSWAVLGAHVTAVDLSDELIRLACQKADQAGLSVKFVCADIGELPPDVGTGRFDITYAAGGVLPWIPDIARWATIVHRSLRPGGRFVLIDEHPLLPCLRGSRGGLELIGDYFGRAAEPVVYPGWSHFPGGETASLPKTQFVWPLGDVVTALIESGLVIDELREYPTDEIWRFDGDGDMGRRLPGRFLLIAHRGE